MTGQWQDIPPDDSTNPFGEEEVDAIVYSNDENNPELNIADAMRALTASRPVRTPPQRLQRFSYGQWQPTADQPRLRPPGRTSPILVLLVLAVPVALVIAIVLFFYGAYGDRVPFGNVPVPSAPSVPSAPTGPAPAG